MKKNLIIYSGGLDSTVLLHLHKEDIELAISFNYGSKHNQKEFEAALYNTKVLGIRHLRINLPFVNEHFNSALLTNTYEEIPDGHYEDLSMKRTVVPFRNGIMLAIAAGIASSNNLTGIYIANHSGDHAIYPDCRQEFIDAMSQATEKGTYERVKILAPFTNMTKRDIALTGKEIRVQFENTYSCYKGERIHCGTCGTCVERKEALQGFDLTTYLK